MLPQSVPASPNLSRRLAKLTSILDVAKAMSAERDLDLLLPLILYEATKVVESDRCSLFILDRERNELWSKVAQGSKNEIRLPMGSGIAGQVAHTGAVINIPDAYADPRFNSSFDISSGYRTHTILCVPMRDANGDVTGVIQALNKRGGRVFDAEDEELLLALGAQAAGAIENALLHEEINRLFEGFVSASVVAIEARDPTTAGHSGRVADLTVSLAQALEHHTIGPYALTRFSAVEIQELRYASLLHDFGKVGVRENVLVKAEKLYPYELETLRARFQLARKDLQLRSSRRRLASVEARGVAALPAIHQEEDARLAQELAQLDEVMAFLLTCNRPTVLAQGNFERLLELGKLTYTDAHDQGQPLLLPHEIQSLSITRGTLSPEERREIESHVEHTYRFLSQIPWTRALRRVPEIAYAHHEKLDGTGYPRAIPEIPVQSRMMSICDIYDALTASDRPYKKAVPHGLALDILNKEVGAGQLDRDLFAIFVEAEIPRRALKKGPA
ncbi:HD domain-containing phosphohydrolase [Corallococcus silvisoli]|uniref:HD domain-containing phosphohydrolase n=1 Tax=Corallococcus silvisoli TaxID=2697031 RepID=UPI0013768CFA|nr:HD family phosphohydrolase [Corallococcus silvisoli]NBD12380.1 GAF domain-containing protein [Corallococcus silvisoli]